MPFGGGSGAGVSINPVAFLVVQEQCVKLLPVSHSSAIDKLIDYVPDLMEKVNKTLNKQLEQKQEQMNITNKIIEENSKKKKTDDIPVQNKAAKPEKIIKSEKQRKIPVKKQVDESMYEYEYNEEELEPANDTINIEEEQIDD